MLVIIKKHGLLFCDCGSTLEEMHSFSINLQDMMISDPLGLLKWPVWVDTHSSEKGINSNHMFIEHPKVFD